MKRIRTYLKNLNDRSRGIKKETRNIWVIAAGYALFLLLFLSHYDFNPSATINLSQRNLGIYGNSVPHNLIILKNDGFDGQFYYLMALNPSLSDIHTVRSNFLQRILLPFTVYILSLSYAPIVPLIFIALNFAAALMTSWLLMLILKKYDANSNLVFLWAFGVGALISLSCNLTELWMTCLILAAAYLFEKQSIWISSLALSFAMLARESTITIIAGFVLFCIWRRRYSHAGIFLLSLVPFCIWQAWFFLAYGSVPFHGTGQALAMPHILTSSPAAGSNIIAMSYGKLGELGAMNISLQAITFERITTIYRMFSPWPILCFIAIMGCIAVYNWIREKKLTLYTVLLFSQLAFMCIITPKIMLNEGIEATGRYAIVLCALSLLYFAERGKRYSRILAILLIGSAMAYFMQKAILSNEVYYISGLILDHNLV